MTDTPLSANSNKSTGVQIETPSSITSSIPMKKKQQRGTKTQDVQAETSKLKTYIVSLEQKILDLERSNVILKKASTEDSGSVQYINPHHKENGRDGDSRDIHGKLCAVEGKIDLLLEHQKISLKDGKLDLLLEYVKLRSCNHTQRGSYQSEVVRDRYTHPLYHPLYTTLTPIRADYGQHILPQEIPTRLFGAPLYVPPYTMQRGGIPASNSRLPVYMVNGGQHPGHSGQHPGHSGQHPGHIGQHPGHIGQHPGHMVNGGQHPGHMVNGGQHPGNIGHMVNGRQHPGHMVGSILVTLGNILVTW